MQGTKRRSEISTSDYRKFRVKTYLCGVVELLISAMAFLVLKTQQVNLKTDFKKTVENAAILLKVNCCRFKSHQGRCITSKECLGAKQAIINGLPFVYIRLIFRFLLLPLFWPKHSIQSIYGTLFRLILEHNKASLPRLHAQPNAWHCRFNIFWSKRHV